MQLTLTENDYKYLEAIAEAYYQQTSYQYINMLTETHIQKRALVEMFLLEADDFAQLGKDIANASKEENQKVLQTIVDSARKLKGKPKEFFTKLANFVKQRSKQAVEKGREVTGKGKDIGEKGKEAAKKVAEESKQVVEKTGNIATRMINWFKEKFSGSAKGKSGPAGKVVEKAAEKLDPEKKGLLNSVSQYAERFLKWLEENHEKFLRWLSSKTNINNTYALAIMMGTIFASIFGSILYILMHVPFIGKLIRWTENMLRKILLLPGRMVVKFFKWIGSKFTGDNPEEMDKAEAEAA